MSRFNTGNPIESGDPRDLSDNAKNLDEAMNSESSQWTDRLGNQRKTFRAAENAADFAEQTADNAVNSLIPQQVQRVEERADEAVDTEIPAEVQRAADYVETILEPSSADALDKSVAKSALRAETARDAAFVNADVYEDVATGRAAVADGEQFQVVEGDEIVRYRRDSSFSQTEVARFPAANVVASHKRMLRDPDAVDDVGIAFADTMGFYTTYIDKEGVLRSPVLDSVSSISEADSDTLSFAVVDSLGFAGLAIAKDGEVLGFGFAGQEEQVLLSFVEPWGDPSTDVALTWISGASETAGVTYCESGSSSGSRATSIRSRRFPNSDFYLHTAHLSALTPDTVYEFSIGSMHEETFKTAATDTVKLSAVSDYQQYNFGQNSQVQRIGDNITSEDVDLLLLNGDFVNDDGVYNSTNAGRWLGLLTAIYTWYRTTDGALIPTFATVGNHEGGNFRYGNAFFDGRGDIAYTKDIFSFGYHELSPNRFFNSAMFFQVGERLGVICLETDHTEPLFTQKEWFKSAIERLEYSVEHVFVAGHVGPFATYSESVYTSNTQARELRKNFVTVAQDAGNVRAWLEGHTHKLEIKKPIKYDYDPNLSESDNDTRWFLDNDGIRFIGSGPWGADRRNLSEFFQNLESSIDSSTFTEASLYFRDGQHQVLGNITNASDENVWHHWSMAFSNGAHSIRAVGVDGSQLYEIEG